MNNRRFYFASSALFAAVAGIAPLTGCVETDDHEYHHRRPIEREVVVEEDDHYHRPPPPPPVVVQREPVVVERGPVIVEHDHDHDFDRDHHGPTERARGIPASAKLVEEGKGRIDFRSRRDGDLWIEDTHDLKLVFSGRLFDDEAVVVEPGRDQILINDRRVRVKGLQDDHRYRIYFIPAAGHYERYSKGHDPRFER